VPARSQSLTQEVSQCLLGPPVSPQHPGQDPVVGLAASCSLSERQNALESVLARQTGLAQLTRCGCVQGWRRFLPHDVSAVAWFLMLCWGGMPRSVPAVV
jgi:hypothetical protein